MKRKICKLIIKARGHKSAYMKARRAMREYYETAIMSGVIVRVA